MTSALLPAQLMAETLISRGTLYSHSRTTVVVVVEMLDCVVVFVCILYSSTTPPDSSQEMVMEKLSVS